MWLYCSGSLIPNLLADDTAGVDAAEGTVGHTVGERWLKALKKNPREAFRGMFDDDVDDWIDHLAPRDMIGEVITISQRHESFDITVTEEMLAYVREYVVWCVHLPGEHYIETRTDFSVLTPIPNQKGTADHAACEPGVLTITDLKYGKGVQVFAKWNTQGLIYASGFFLAYDHLYHFERIVIRIGQPRLSHWDEWEVSREELLKFMEWVKVRAALAWDPEAPRTPGKKQCQWCKVIDTCAARAAWLIDQEEGTFPVYNEDGDEITVQPDGTIEGVSYSVKDMEVTSAALVSGKARVGRGRNPGELPTEALELIALQRKAVEKWFAAISAELLARAEDGEELKHWKLVPGRASDREWAKEEEQMTEDLEFLGVPEDEAFVRQMKSPAQIEEYLHKTYGMKKSVAKVLVNGMTVRRAGKDTLAPITDTREAIEDAGSVFEVVPDDDDGL